MVDFASNEDVAEIANSRSCGLKITPEDVELAGGECPIMLENVDDWAHHIKSESEATETLGSLYDSGGFEGELRRCAIAIAKDHGASPEAKTLAMSVLGIPGEQCSVARQYVENGGRLAVEYRFDQDYRY